MPSPCTIVWIRRDLRLEDNPALSAASKIGPVLPVFIWSPEEEAQFQPGRVSRWWLKQSLLQLASSLQGIGSSLIIRRSPDSLTVLLELVEITGAQHVFYNHLYDPMSLVRDHHVKQALCQRGIQVNSFNGDLLYEPWEIHDDHGKPFTTFEKYWQKVLHMPFEPDSPLSAPRRLSTVSVKISMCTPDELGLEDEMEKSSNALLARAWAPGWSNADKALEDFLSGPLLQYSQNRHKIDAPTSSLLSPHLHFGEISVRKVYHAVRRMQILWAQQGAATSEESIYFFLRSIGFREYSRYLSFNFPFTHERSLLSNLKSFPWRADEGLFKAWRQGRTGYPLVDAGMRELWATGWLHNRVRVIVSSFCVKFLQLPWRWGMKYFWDTLLDADLESDVLGWQYISGSLPDGHDLDRMDNPQTEGYKHDPCGEYVRRWLPELVRLPTEWIHHPWDAPPSVLRAAGVELGSNYPRPIVEMISARERLQQAVAQMWEQEAALKSAGIQGDDKSVNDETKISAHLLATTQQMKAAEVGLTRASNVMFSASSHRDQMVPTFAKHFKIYKLPSEAPKTTLPAVETSSHEDNMRPSSHEDNMRPSSFPSTTVDVSQPSVTRIKHEDYHHRMSTENSTAESSSSPKNHYVTRIDTPSTWVIHHGSSYSVGCIPNGDSAVNVKYQDVIVENTNIDDKVSEAKQFVQGRKRKHRI